MYRDLYRHRYLLQVLKIIPIVFGCSIVASFLLIAIAGSFSIVRIYCANLFFSIYDSMSLRVIFGILTLIGSAMVIAMFLENPDFLEDKGSLGVKFVIGICFLGILLALPYWLFAPLAMLTLAITGGYLLDSFLSVVIGMSVAISANVILPAIGISTLIGTLGLLLWDATNRFSKE